jgi:hypothetical protein
MQILLVHATRNIALWGYGRIRTGLPLLVLPS